jgi:hypothetical protein
MLDALISAVENGVPVKDDEGNVHLAPPPAQLLAVAAKVVKDFHDEVNAKESKSAALSATLSKYADRMPSSVRN